jgi:hypothetical protein
MSSIVFSSKIIRSMVFCGSFVHTYDSISLCILNTHILFWSVMCKLLISKLGTFIHFNDTFVWVKHNAQMSSCPSCRSNCKIAKWCYQQWHSLWTNVSNLKVVQKWKEFKEIDYMKAWAKLEYNQWLYANPNWVKTCIDHGNYYRFTTSCWYSNMSWGYFPQGYQMFLERVISLLHTLYAATFQIWGRGFCSIWNLALWAKALHALI